jgi:hypothetical protein
LFICSASISAVFFSGSPKKEALPVAEKRAPTLNAMTGLAHSKKPKKQIEIIAAIFFEVIYPPFVMVLKLRSLFQTALYKYSDNNV